MSSIGMAGSLTGQVALVTGAGRGMGRGIAVELARRGADVVVVARTARSEGPGGSVDATARAVEALGRRALRAPMDVTDDDAAATLVDCVLADWQRIDVLVNCAGIISLTDLFETTPKRLDLLWRVNARAPFVLMRLVAPSMVERGRGHIVNIGTLSSQWRGTRVPLGFLGYTATKAALVRMSHAVALDLLPHGVAVNVASPSAFVATAGWETASGGTYELPATEPADLLPRTVAWIVEQDPRRFTGRFVETQQLMDSVGELDGPAAGFDDLPHVDVAALMEAGRV